MIGMIRTHRKNNNNLPLPFHNNSQIKPHLKPAEGLVDENILDLVRRDEARWRG